MSKIIKRIIYGIAVIIFLVVFFSEDEEYLEKELIGTTGDPNQTWSIYWYLCGSDLESDGGAASMDLEELKTVQLPSNVRVVIQTGGASNWENDKIKSNKIQRYLYNSEGLKLIDEKPQSNMGDANTLADFLKYASNNYPADKKMAIFWNHGGGTVAGASFDENYNDDSLTLSEFDNAFRQVFPLSQENPPFEVIGFDTCLMATVDTAYTFSDIGKYLVASEEMEPGTGWAYDRFMTELAKDPGMDGARLGQHICDTYMDSCGWLFEDEATLSVVDLKKSRSLFDAYENLGAEALVTALNDPWFFVDLGREAELAENYGGNTRDQGYTNMMDLGDFAKNCEAILPKNSQRVVDTLKECVLYQTKGIYRDNASGLSCYYSYNGDPEDFYNYLGQGCSDSFKYLYGYGFIGELPPEGMQYLQQLGYKNKALPHVPNIEEDGEKEYPIDLDENGLVELKLNEKTRKLLKSIFCNYAYIDEKNDKMVMLGVDNDMDADFENGIFKDNFRGVWGAIDGHLVYMEVVFESENYTAFSIPILLNDKEYNLRVIYDFDKEKFKIIGARKGLEDNGMADKNLIELKEGDQITPIHYEMSISGDDEPIAVKKETFTVTKNTKFEEKELPDGKYLMMYELIDSKNNSQYSESAEFTIKGEDIDVSI